MEHLTLGGFPIRDQYQGTMIYGRDPVLWVVFILCTFPAPFLSCLDSFCFDEIRGREYVCWVVGERGEAWIKRIEDLMLAISLGILTDNPSIIEILGFNWRGKGFTRNIYDKMKEECTYGMQTFGKYSLNEFIKKGVWKAWVIIVGGLIEGDFSFLSFHNSWQCSFNHFYYDWLWLLSFYIQVTQSYFSPLWPIWR